jgi:AAA domain-containing protein
MTNNRKPRKRAVAYGNEWVRTLDRSTEWIWEGVIAEDAITVLSAPEKTGKSTLLSLLLDRRREGGRREV